MVRLNPLIKIESLFENRCTVKLLLDNVSYSVNTKLIVSILRYVEENGEDIRLNLFKLWLISYYKTEELEAKSLIKDLLNKKIFVENIQNYPINQIEHWIKRNWLNALIYHLESRNIEYLDDGSRYGEDRKIYSFDYTKKGNIWKEYGNLEVCNLPEPDISRFDSISLEDTLLRRSSFDPFIKCPIKLEDLSDILYMSNKDLVSNRIKLEKSLQNLYDSSFTAFETYIFVFSVHGLDRGLYHYNPKSHSLSLIKKGNLRKDVIDICIGQVQMSSGGCLFLITANAKRYMMRYKHERAYRNMLVNVAEFAQQYIFFSTALRYSTNLTPALNDMFAHKILGLNNFDEIPLYTIGIG